MNYLVLIVLLIVHTAHQQAEVKEYKTEIDYFLNEVEESAKSALQIVELLLEGGLTDEPDDYHIKTQEIEDKCDKIILQLEETIQRENSTSGDNECLVILHKDTQDEIKIYLAILDNTCTDRTKVNTTLNNIHDNTTELVQLSENLYQTFLYEAMKCSLTPDYNKCIVDVEDTVTKRGEELTALSYTYVKESVRTYQGYMKGVEICVELVYEKIDLIETNVRNGIRDCLSTTSH